jgi:hypothetical protein
MDTQQLITIQNMMDLLLNPVVTFVIGILTLLLTRKGDCSATARERLDSVYHPLFLAIEPFLYKQVNYETVLPFIQKYYEIEEHYSLLINPSLRQAVKTLPHSADSYETDKYGYNPWFVICKYVSKDYDRLCKQAHLPVRSISYRVINKQYKSVISVIFGEIILSLPGIIFFSILLGFTFPKMLKMIYELFAIVLLIKILKSL